MGRTWGARGKHLCVDWLNPAHEGPPVTWRARATPGHHLFLQNAVDEKGEFPLASRHPLLNRWLYLQMCASAVVSLPLAMTKIKFHCLFFFFFAFPGALPFFCCIPPDAAATTKRARAATLVLFEDDELDW